MTLFNPLTLALPTLKQGEVSKDFSLEDFDENKVATEADLAVIFDALLGRAPKASAIQTYINNPNKTWTLGEIKEDIKGSDEYFRRYNDPLFEVKYGVDAGQKKQQHQTFGGADYIQALKKGGELNLEQTRLEILEWLQGSQKWLSPENRKLATNPGMPGDVGLFDRIKGVGKKGDINPSWGDYSADHLAGSFFTYDDLLATRAQGFEESEIKEALDKNLNWLKKKDKPEVEGGLYESLYISKDLDDWTPDLPTVTYNPSEYDVKREREIVTRDAKDSLKINTGESFVGKTARGVETAKRTRRRVRQTTDLQRSLNIS